MPESAQVTDWLLDSDPSIRWQVLRDLAGAPEPERQAERAKAAVPVPDARLGEATGIVRARRQEDGTWLLDRHLPGRVWFDVDDGAGQPSRWVTLHALRVLRWREAAA